MKGTQTTSLPEGSYEVNIQPTKVIKINEYELGLDDSIKIIREYLAGDDIFSPILKSIIKDIENLKNANHGK